MTEIIMPKAGMDMQEGKLIRWLKNVGDKVEFDEPIMEIETDKITMEWESPASGTILAQYAGDGDVLPVLTVIGYIGNEGDVPPAAPGAAEEKKEAPVQDSASGCEEADAPAGKTVLRQSGDYCPATPYAKTLAAEKNIDLSDVSASGASNEIKARDVIAYAEKPKAVPAAPAAPAVPAAQQRSLREGEQRIPMTDMQKIIAQRLSKKCSECPVVTQNMLIDVTQLLEMRKQMNAAMDNKITINDLVIKAVARTVSEQVKARTQVDGDSYIISDKTNIGFAVGMDEGLIVPVIHDADKMSISEISVKARDLATRARSNNLKLDEISGGVFTISNMGMFNVHSFTPIINMNEAGILGVCNIEKHLALENGKTIEKSRMMISLTYDHRVMNGTDAAKFELRIKELLENPVWVLC